MLSGWEEDAISYVKEEDVGHLGNIIRFTCGIVFFIFFLRGTKRLVFHINLIFHVFEKE